MSASLLQALQDQISSLLLQHKNLLDIISKYSQASGSVNRVVTKAITECGCLELHSKYPSYKKSSPASQVEQTSETHIHGELCDNCRDIIISELGKHLFYMSTLCNLLDIELEDVVQHEFSKCQTLGVFNLF